MKDLPIDKLIAKTGSVYKLVTIATARAIELSEGATKLVETSSDEKPVNIALMEILDDKVTFKLKEAK